MNSQKKTMSLLLVALFTALVAVGGFIRIPTPIVPITLQFWFTVMAGLLLGPKLGALSVLVYVILGLIGVPIFTQGGGPGYIFQPTFGYLLGFVAGTWVVGKLAWKKEQPDFKQLLFACLAGAAVVYTAGTVYCFIISKYVLGAEIIALPFLASCVFLPLPSDLVLCVFSAFLGKRLIPVLKRYQIQS